MERSYIFLIVAVLFLVISCSDDEMVDPCENITCVNGECVNGQCDCDDGYEGPDCSKEATPSAIVLKKITVTNFDATKDNGAGWDSNDGPDLHFVIEYNNFTLYETDGYYEDATNDNNYEFVIPANTKVFAVKDLHEFILYDYEDYLIGQDSKERMGDVLSPVWLEGQGFPTLINFMDNESSLEFRLEVEYEFD